MHLIEQLWALLDLVYYNWGKGLGIERLLVAFSEERGFGSVLREHVTFEEVDMGGVWQGALNPTALANLPWTPKEDILLREIR